MALENEKAVAADWKTGDKCRFVMAHALDLLIEAGYQGLTMRGIAERCGMSLSNVQYYFRSKEALITQIADLYFGECGLMLANHFDRNGPVHDRSTLKDLVALFLEHGREMNDMCRVFRELWAIGSRNEKIAELLNHHYERLGQILKQNIQHPSNDAETAERMSHMLLVISEGYSIVGHAGALNYEQALDLFTDSLEGASVTRP